MLETLTQAGRHMGHRINRAWEGLAEGWRELVGQSRDALTHFWRAPESASGRSPALAGFPRWGLLAGEVEETAREVIVRLELPGIEKEDCEVTIAGDMLQVSGEKRVDREFDRSTFHVMECAYGAFTRRVPLPCEVDSGAAQARYRNGVLTIRAPKRGAGNARTVRVD